MPSVRAGNADAFALRMNPKTVELKARTKAFAISVIDFVEKLPTRGPATRIADQLTDSGTSTAANYRSACRGRSRAEFAAKIGVALEEADESLFWLELCDARSWGPALDRTRLMKEADELTAIFAASYMTAREPR